MGVNLFLIKNLILKNSTLTFMFFQLINYMAHLDLVYFT